MKYGFVKVATAIPMGKVADCGFNAQQIENLIAVAEGKGVEIIAFPELCMTSYTCGDLFRQTLLLEEAEIALMKILNDTRQMNIISIIGMPIAYEKSLLNSAVVVQKGKIVGIVPKTYLPNDKACDEKRWFSAAGEVPEGEMRICGQLVPVSSHLLFDTSETCFGIELCEDLWAPIPPSSTLALKGAEIVFNLSAESECIGKHEYLLSLIAQQSARCLSGYVYSSCGYGESTTDLVFAGNGFIYECGHQIAVSKRFQYKEQLIIGEVDVDRIRNERRVNTAFTASIGECKQLPVKHINTEFLNRPDLVLTRTYSPHPFVPEDPNKLDERCEEIFRIQIAGLIKRMDHTRCEKLVVGISGGLDSTLALMVCVHVFDQLKMGHEGIIAVTMPGFGTTDRTHRNAVNLMKAVGVTVREIDIKEACIQHFKDIGHRADVHDVTYENSQARERTQILMDIANQVGALVVGTGDLSELALGWATYNGDHMSMYSVNAGIPKTLIAHLVSWIARNGVDEATKKILSDIVDTPISPELIPADEQGNIRQKTEDLIGPYELHDFFLYYFFRFGYRPSKIFLLAARAFKGKYTEEVIKKWIHLFFRRFFQQQFKRSCLPDGPKVGSVALSPRGNWHMPSDASPTLWLKECEEL